MMNLSGKWYMLSRSGQVVEGEDNPEAASVLAAPGGNVPQDIVDKYDLADRLKGEEVHQIDVAGRPIVLTESGRAVSIDLLEKDSPVRKKAEADIAKKAAPTPLHSPPVAVTPTPAPAPAAPVAPVPPKA